MCALIQNNTEITDLYDVPPDGKRFLVDSMGGDESTAVPFQIGLNWQQVLKKERRDSFLKTRLVPKDKTRS